MKITPINGNAETEGVEFVYRGNKLIVARAGNTNFKKVFREMMKPYNDDLDNNRMDEETSRKIMIDCTAQAILVGWETITGADGESYEYSLENAKELLSDDADCYDAIISFSSDIENYLTADEEKLKVK